MNMDTHGKYNFDFGLSFAHGPDDLGEIFRNYDGLCFKHLELSGIQSETDSLSSLLRYDGVKTISIRNLLDRTLTVNICEQVERIRRDFFECFNRRIELLYDGGGHGRFSISMDFSIESGYGSPLFEDSRIELIKRVACLLYKKDIKFLLNVRIPDNSRVPPSYFNSILMKLMSPNVSIALDVHPHEISKKTDIGELFRPFRFTVSQINFIYEAENGNLMVDKLIDFWLEMLANYKYEGPLVFAPVISSPVLFISEMSRLSQILACK